MADAGCDKAYDALKAKQEGSAKAKNVLRGAGYARGGGVGVPKVKKHGDKVDGKHSKSRADKFSRGGSAPSGKHTKTHIAINVGAGEAEKRNALQQGMQLGAKLAAAKMAGAARPGAGAPTQARGPAPMPQGGPPMGGGVPPTMANRGGRFAKGGKVTGLPPGLKGKNGGGPKRISGVPHLSGSAAGGLGRLQKKAQYGTKPKA